MGKAVEKIRLTNFTDPTKQVEVEALVDTGATMLLLPEDVIKQLGLRKMREVPVRYADNSIKQKSIYGGIILEMKGREGEFEAICEVEGSQALVGQVVLEVLDLVVNPKTHQVMPDPISPDMLVIDMLAISDTPA